MLLEATRVCVPLTRELPVCALNALLMHSDPEPRRVEDVRRWMCRKSWSAIQHSTARCHSMTAMPQDACTPRDAVYMPWTPPPLHGRQPGHAPTHR